MVVSQMEKPQLSIITGLVVQKEPGPQSLSAVHSFVQVSIVVHKPVPAALFTVESQ